MNIVIKGYILLPYISLGRLHYSTEISFSGTSTYYLGNVSLFVVLLLVKSEKHSLFLFDNFLQFII